MEAKGMNSTKWLNYARQAALTCVDHCVVQKIKNPDYKVIIFLYVFLVSWTVVHLSVHTLIRKRQVGYVMSIFNSARILHCVLQLSFNF